MMDKKKLSLLLLLGTSTLGSQAFGMADAKDDPSLSTDGNRVALPRPQALRGPIDDGRRAAAAVATTDKEDDAHTDEGVDTGAGSPSGIPAKAAAAAHKPEAVSQPAGSAKLMKKVLGHEHFTKSSAQKVSYGSGQSIEIMAGNDLAGYQAFSTLKDVDLSQGFRVRYRVRTEGAQFNLFVLKNGGYLPQQTGAKIRTLEANKKSDDFLEYGPQGEGQYLFVVGNNRAPSAGVGALPPAKAILESITIEAVAKAVAAGAGGAAAPAASAAIPASAAPAQQPTAASGASVPAMGGSGEGAGVSTGPSKQLVAIPAKATGASAGIARAGVWRISTHPNGAKTAQPQLQGDAGGAAVAQFQPHAGGPVAQPQPQPQGDAGSAAGPVPAIAARTSRSGLNLDRQDKVERGADNVVAELQNAGKGAVTVGKKAETVVRKLRDEIFR